MDESAFLNHELMCFDLRRSPCSSRVSLPTVLHSSVALPSMTRRSHTSQTCISPIPSQLLFLNRRAKNRAFLHVKVVTVSLPLNFHVAQYDGPLDLLLDLIRKQQINISDIPIAQITGQYIEFMQRAIEHDIDLSSDFVYMAATLIHIKSRMLLPRDPELEKISPEEDPRKELVERLIEHDRFKNAAEMLQQKRLIEDASWSNPQIEQFLAEDEGPGLAVNIFDLVKTLQAVLERAQTRPVYEIGQEMVSVPDMILYVRQHLTSLKSQEAISATYLFRISTQPPRYDLSVPGHLRVGKTAKRIAHTRRKLLAISALNVGPYLKKKQWQTWKLWNRITADRSNARIRRNQHHKRMLGTNRTFQPMSPSTPNSSQTWTSEDILIETVTEPAAPTPDNRDVLKAVIEAAIYITDEPLSAEQIANSVEQPLERVKEILAQLVAEYSAPDRGLAVREIAGGYKMSTKPEHHEPNQPIRKEIADSG